MKVLPSAWCSIPKPTSPAGFLPLYCSARPVHSNPEYILVPTPAPDLLHHLSMPSLHYHLPGQPQHSMVAPQHQPYSIIYSSHDIFGGFLQCKSEDVSSFCLIPSTVFSSHLGSQFWWGYLLPFPKNAAMTLHNIFCLPLWIHSTPWHLTGRDWLLFILPLPPPP